MPKKLLVASALLKSHIGTYTRKDGTVVAAHEDGRAASRDVQRHEVKGVAEHVAGRFREHGFDAQVEHSGSAAGASSYIRVHDPKTGRSINDSIRVSDHSKGAFNSQFHHHIWSHDDVEPVVGRLLETAHSMRAQGPASGAKAQDEREAKAVEIRLASARKKQAKGKPLTNSERESLESVGELAKSSAATRYMLLVKSTNNHAGMHAPDSGKRIMQAVVPRALS